MTTPTELARLRQVAEAATPGPWMFERQSWEDGGFSYEIQESEPSRFVAIYEYNYDVRMRAKFDSQFIATFNPEKCLDLLYEIEEHRDWARCGADKIIALEAELKKAREGYISFDDLTLCLGQQEARRIEDWLANRGGGG